MTMTAEQLARLREVAERAASDDWGYDHDEFCESLTPGMILALLDELEARTVTVKLPDVEKWRPIKDVRGQIAYRALVIKTLAAAGINLTVEG
ncbi:hypothetical protein [Atlantibacter hermannii]|uniref:hypothetical protein n=1 Tax=Atlantibacter hermannii TaxID=565 RepID=UPI0028B035D5|nr:hypothetical protein [Atlantibacter hermannii]